MDGQKRKTNERTHTYILSMELGGSFVCLLVFLSLVVLTSRDATAKTCAFSSVSLKHINRSCCGGVSCVSSNVCLLHTASFSSRSRAKEVPHVHDLEGPEGGFLLFRFDDLLFCFATVSGAVALYIYTHTKTVGASPRAWDTHSVTDSLSLRKLDLRRYGRN